MKLKNFWKRALALFSTLVLSCALLFSFVACQKTVKVDGDYVIITAQKVEENETLEEYMLSLQADGKLTVETQDGGYGAFIVSVNGKANSTNSYWMIYTSDSENADAANNAEYDGKLYGSASVGISSLIVKEGETYILYYQTF